MRQNQAFASISQAATAKSCHALNLYCQQAVFKYYARGALQIEDLKSGLFFIV
jgi:hypothetical protein